MRKIHNRHVGIGHRYRDTFALDLLLAWILGV